jgi:hypothetical protein
VVLTRRSVKPGFPSRSDLPRAMGIRRVLLPLHDPYPPAAPSDRDRTPRPGQALLAPVRQLIEFLYDTLLCR